MERRTSRRRGIALASLVGALILGGLVALGPSEPEPAAAAEVPIVNAPPGGGEIVYETASYGPVDLAAMGQPGWQDMYDGPVARPPGAYAVKSITFDIVDQNGVSIPKHDVHMHHFVIGKAFEQDPACPERTALDIEVKPLVGTGMERTPIAFPDPYGILVGQDDIWGATSHLMNMTDTPKTIYVKYTIGLQRGATPDNTRDLTPFWADWDGCLSGHTLDLPGGGAPGSLVTKTTDWTMPADGIVVGMGGHFHDGGIDMNVDHGDGTRICRSYGEYKVMMSGDPAPGPGPGNMLDHIVPCLVHDTVTAGEQLRVTGNYDGQYQWDDVMGIAVMYIWFGAQGDPVTTPSSTNPIGPPPTVVVTPSFTG